MISERYNIDNLRQALREPRHFIEEPIRLKNRILIRKLSNILYNGENFFENDWDNLIILDACRPDFFEKYNSLEGDYSRKISLGASSNEYFIRNLKGKEYYDTVYITGNTSVERVDDSLYRVIKTYADTEKFQKGWKPEVTFNAGIEAYKQHPNKRLVIHFMQPHTPYLSDRAEKLRQRVNNEYDVGFRTIQNVRDDGQKYDEKFTDLVDAYEHGYISRDELHSVYAENLELAFEYVDELLDVIEGKTVITADHSESLGEVNGISTHRDWALSKKLREVPWLEIEGNRRETFAEQPVKSVSVDDEVIRENLRDLGYL